MKKLLISILASISIAPAVYAGEFLKLNTPYSIIGSNYVVAATLTNIAPYTVTNIEYTYRGIYQTIHVLSSTTGSNSITATISRSIDGVYFYPVQTNNISTNGIAEYTAVGKWAYHRIVWNISGTNGFVQFNIMNQ